MRLRDTVQSKWLKVSDLPGAERGWLDLTISKVGMSRFADGRESVDLYFHEHPKPLGANTTNRKRLMAIFGEDVLLEDLIGRRIRVYAELTQNSQGEAVWGMRLGPIPNTVQAASSLAREKIEAAQLRQAAPSRVERPAPAGLVPDGRGGFVQPPRARPAQDAPNGSARPSGPAPRVDDLTGFAPAEPAGFVDDQDPGFDQDPQAGGQW